MADWPPKKNVAYTFRIGGLTSQANPAIFQVNPTLATGDVKVSLDGAAPTNITTLPTVVNSSFPEIAVALSQTEMNHDEIIVLFHDAAGAEWCDGSVPIPTVARQLTDLAYPATSGRSMVVDAAGLVDANMVKAGPTGSGTAQTARDIGASVVVATNNDKTGYALSSAGVQAIWDALTSALTTVGSIGKRLADDIDAVLSSRLATSSYTAPLDAAGTRGAVGLATANLDTQLSSLQSDTDNIQTRLPAALTGGGNIKADSQVVSDKTGYALVDGAITAAKIADGAITTLKIADGALTAAKFASGALDAVWSTATRLLTAGTNIVLAKGTGVTGFNDPTANQNADALLDRADGVETGWTPRQAFRIALSALAGKVSGAQANAPKFRDMADSKNRISATTDQAGNRSSVTLDAS